MWDMVKKNCVETTALRLRYWVRGFLLGALVVGPCVGLRVAGGQTQRASNDAKALRTIGFMTDFDVRDDAVGICKAVMNGVAPG